MLGGILQDVIAGLILAGLLGGAGYFSWRPLMDRWQGRMQPRAPGTHLSILVARLEGDPYRAQTGHVIASLRSELVRKPGGPVVHVTEYPEVLAPGKGEIGAADAAAEAKGRDWLQRKDADVLIWGSVAEENSVLRLRLLARDGDGSAKSYALNEVLELPADFTADLGAVLAISAAAAVQPVHGNPGQALA
jgi:hypothetical protein